MPQPTALPRTPHKLILFSCQSVWLHNDLSKHWQIFVNLVWIQCHKTPYVSAFSFSTAYSNNMERVRTSEEEEMPAPCNICFGSSVPVFTLKMYKLPFRPFSTKRTALKWLTHEIFYSPPHSTVSQWLRAAQIGLDLWKEAKPVLPKWSGLITQQAVVKGKNKKGFLNNAQPHQTL
jgi:hypothetical protein